MGRKDEEARFRKTVAKECFSMKSFVTVKPKVQKVENEQMSNTETVVQTKAKNENQCQNTCEMNESEPSFNDLPLGLGEK